MNKNTRRIKVQLAKVFRQGENAVTINVPVPNYHSVPSSSLSDHLRPKTFTISRRGKEGVISANATRNSQMRTLCNRAENNRTASLTVHEALVKGCPIVFKNHGYMEYRS